MGNQKEWFYYSLQELKESEEKQREVFTQMLRKLEVNGHCRHVFHRLAFVIFKDELES